MGTGIAIVIGQTVEEILESKWGVIADLVNPADVLAFNRRLKRQQEIRQGNQMGPGRMSPYCHQSMSQQPSSALHQLDLTSINDTGSKYDRRRSTILTSFQ